MLLNEERRGAGGPFMMLRLNTWQAGPGTAPKNSAILVPTSSCFYIVAEDSGSGRVLCTKDEISTFQTSSDTELVLQLTDSAKTAFTSSEITMVFSISDDCNMVAQDLELCLNSQDREDTKEVKVSKSMTDIAAPMWKVSDRRLMQAQRYHEVEQLARPSSASNALELAHVTTPRAEAGVSPEALLLKSPYGRLLREDLASHSEYIHCHDAVENCDNIQQAATNFATILQADGPVTPERIRSALFEEMCSSLSDASVEDLLERPTKSSAIPRNNTQVEQLFNEFVETKALLDESDKIETQSKIHSPNQNQKGSYSSNTSENMSGASDPYVLKSQAVFLVLMSTSIVHPEPQLEDRSNCAEQHEAPTRSLHENIQDVLTKQQVQGDTTSVGAQMIKGALPTKITEVVSAPSILHKSLSLPLHDRSDDTDYDMDSGITRQKSAKTFSEHTNSRFKGRSRSRKSLSGQDSDFKYEQVIRTNRSNDAVTSQGNDKGNDRPGGTKVIDRAKARRKQQVGILEERHSSRSCLRSSGSEIEQNKGSVHLTPSDRLAEIDTIQPGHQTKPASDHARNPFVAPQDSTKRNRQNDFADTLIDEAKMKRPHIIRWLVVDITSGF